MQVDNLPGDIEAKAHAGQVIVVMSLVKPVKHGFTLLGWNAHTLISDRKLDGAVVVLVELDCHAATSGTVLDGIANQIRDDLLEPHRIDHCLQVIRAVKDKHVGGADLLL